MEANFENIYKFLKENDDLEIEMYEDVKQNQINVVIISICENIAKNKILADKLKEKFDYSSKIEGYFRGEWIVFDFDKVVLHLVIPNIKSKYNLEKLYKNKKVVL